MNNFLLWLAGLLIFMFAVLFAGPYFVDWNGYRSVFEAQASRILGRPVTLEGEVNLRLLPAPYVQFEQVRVAARPAAPEDALLSISNYTLWLSVPPLLQGEIVGQAMQIERPVLRLKVGEDGAFAFSNIKPDTARLPFAPRNIAFRNVAITDGVIAVIDAADREVAKVEGISGTLTATALNGPFKFDGTVLDAGATAAGRGATENNAADDDAEDRGAATAATPWSVRWSTGRLDADGGLRVKGQLGLAEQNLTVAFDGQTQSILRAPKFIGAIAARRRGEDALGFEMKADVFADTAQASVQNLALLLDVEGRPQLLEGKGGAVWRPGAPREATVELTSRWLDLDRISSAEKNLSTHARARTIVRTVTSLMNRLHLTGAIFKATQVRLNGAPIDALDIALERRDAELRVARLSANLPGAARVTLDGALADTAPPSPARASGSAQELFSGRLSLEGRALSRFVRWLRPEGSDDLRRLPGVFSLDSAVRLTRGGFALTAGEGRVGETRISGELQYRRAPDERLSVALDAVRYDATRSYASLGAIADAMRGPPPAAEPPPAADGGSAARAQDAVTTDLAVKVAELVVGDATLNDVQLDLTNDAPNAVGGNSLNVRRLAFTTVEGLEVDLASTVPDPTGAASSGPRRFVLRVPTRDALMQVFSVAGMSPKGDMLEKLAGATLPAAIAGRIEHDREAGRLALRYDGMLAGNTAVGQVEIVGSDADPAAREWTVVTDIDLAQPGVVTTALGLPKGLLSAREPDAPATPERGKKNRLVVYAIGRPADALRGDLVIETPDVDLRFAGTVQTARPARATATASSASTLGPLVVRGRIEGALNAGAPVRQLFALPETGPRGQRLAFSAELAHADARTRLDKLGFSLAEVEGSGAATVSWPSSGARIEAELKTSALSMARAAALVVEPPRDDSDTGLWPTRPFAFPPLGLTTMTARIEVGVLHLSDDARFSNVRATLEMDENGVRVSGLDGEAAGGRISGDAALAKRPAGAEFTVRIEGRSLSLAALAGASATPADGATESAGARAATVVPLADGPATTTPQSSDPAPVGQQPPLEGRLDLTLKARGIGLSPRGLVAVLSGAGEARMQRATVRDFSPQIIQDVAADVRDDNDPVDARMLKARLADRMDDRGLELGTHTLRLTVRDGVLDFAPLALSTPASRIEAKTFVDLARLRLDSEWRVAPLRASDVQPVSGAALPPVTVLYAGPLLRTEKIARDFAVAALERELTVRRLEGNIDQLEGVRALERAARRGQAALSPESGDDGAASDDDLPARPPRPTITGSVSPSAAETVPRPRGASRSDPSAIPPTPRIAPQAAPRPANPNVPRTTPRAARRSPPTRTRTRPRVTAPTPPVQGLWGQESVDGLTRDPPPLELELQTPAELGN